MWFTFISDNGISYGKEILDVSSFDWLGSSTSKMSYLFWEGNGVTFSLYFEVFLDWILSPSSEMTHSWPKGPRIVDAPKVFGVSELWSLVVAALFVVWMSFFSVSDLLRHKIGLGLAISWSKAMFISCSISSFLGSIYSSPSIYLHFKFLG